MLTPGSWPIYLILLSLISASRQSVAAAAQVKSESRSIATSAYSASQILREWFSAVTEGLRHDNNKDGADGPSNVAEFSHDYLSADRLANWLRDQTKLFGQFAGKPALVSVPKTKASPAMTKDTEKAMQDNKIDGEKSSRTIRL